MLRSNLKRSGGRVLLKAVPAGGCVRAFALENRLFSELQPEPPARHGANASAKWDPILAGDGDALLKPELVDVRLRLEQGVQRAGRRERLGRF